MEKIGVCGCLSQSTISATRPTKSSTTRPTKQKKNVPKKPPVPKNDANVDNILVAEDTQPVVQIGTQEYDLTAAMAKLQQLLASDEENTDSDDTDLDLSLIHI